MINKIHIDKQAKKVRQKRQDAQKEHDDPRLELRLLVKRRSDQIRMRNALANMTREREARKDTPELGWKKGDRIPPSLSDDLCLTIAGFIKQLEKPSMDGLSALGDDSRYGTIAETESAIKRELKALAKTETPSGAVVRFLLGIHGLGEMTAAELVASIDFDNCVKPSQLIRFCGMGHTHDRRHLDSKSNSGGKLRYKSGLRTALWNAAESMAKACTIAGCGIGSRWSTKYTDIWAQYVERERLSPRMLADHNLIDTDVAGSNADLVRSGAMTVKEAKAELKKRDGKFRSAAGFMRSKGRWKMVDAILYDLYLVGRSAHGLSVHCTWHEKARQRAHGTDETIDPNAPPRVLSLEQALEEVGFTGKREVGRAAE